MKSKKNICFLVNVDWFYLSHRKVLADMFVKNNYTVSVIAGKSQENEIPNLTYFQIKSRLPTLFGLFQIFKTIIVKEKNSLYIVVSPIMIFYFHFFFFFKKFAYYNFSGFGFIRSLTIKRQNILFNLMNYMPIFGNRVVIVQNNHDYKYLKKKITNRKIQIRLIPGSGYENNFSSSNNFKSILTIGFVGRIRKDKGVLSIIRAVNELKKSNYLINLVIWGNIDYEGGHQFTSEELVYLNQNKQYLKGLSLSKTQIYSSFDVFCLPSSGEGLSKSAIEASSFGKILLLSDVPGNSDMISENGFLFKYENIKELKSKILILYKMKYDEKKLMSANAKKIFKQKWSLKSIASKWLENMEIDKNIT